MMQHLYEYGAMQLHEFLQVIEEMREYRMQITMPAELGHAMALLNAKAVVR